MSGYTESEVDYLTTYIDTTTTYAQLFLGKNRFLINNFNMNTADPHTPSINININFFVDSTFIYDDPKFCFSLFIGIRNLSNPDGEFINNISYYAGLSFSRSHISRDMVYFEYLTNQSILVTDAFSILGMAPFSDTSSNINGANNIRTVTAIHNNNFSYVQINRSFKSTDSSGDE